MNHANRHKHKSVGKSSTGISRIVRMKAFWLLIILGVVVMLVYSVSFQEAEDSEFIQETQPQSTNP
jgi:hypothetical protein